MSKTALFNAVYQTGDERNFKMPDGSIHNDLCIANIGTLQGQSRQISAILCDNAGSANWSVFNVVQPDRTEQVAVAGAVSEDQAERLVKRYLLPLMNGNLHSSQSLTDSGMKRFLNSAQIPSNTQYLLKDDAEHFNNRISKEQPIWDECSIKSHGGLFAQFMFDLVQNDSSAELFDSVTPKQIAETLIDQHCEFAIHDAMVIQYQEFEKVIDKITKQLQALGDKKFYVEEVTKLKPFKRLGVVNVAAVFTMSDTQTITVILNNPDSTPSKLSQEDVLTSWKWMLNRRDVTAALQPRAVDSKKFNLIAQRMMKLLVSNHPRYIRAQAEKLRLQQKFDNAKQALTTAQDTLVSLDQQITDQQKLIDEHAQKQQANFENSVAAESGAAKENKPDDLTHKGTEQVPAKRTGIVHSGQAVVLNGNELGEFPDTPEGLKALRNAAKEELTKILGEWVECPALGKPVEIRKSGLKKIFRFSGDPKKLKVIAALKDLIFIAKKYDEKTTYTHETESNIKAYHYLQASVILQGEHLYVRFVIREDDKGQYHYDHTVENEAPENTKSPLLDGLNVAAIPTTGDSQEKLDPLIRIGRCHLNSILENDETSVNIHLLDSAISEDKEEDDERDSLLNLFIYKDEAMK